ncbi:MAG: hypothetical protein QGG40_15025 [Myxococcota bacterium]|nr:hypothetical protein [Myxococcota bacterium]
MSEDPDRARSQPPLGEGSAFRSLAVSAGFQQVGGSRAEMLGADGLAPGALVAPAHRIVPHELVEGGAGEEQPVGEPDADGTETHATVEHRVMPPERGANAPGFTLYLLDSAGRLGATPVVRVGVVSFTPTDDGQGVDEVAQDGTWTVMVERYDGAEPVELQDAGGNQLYSGAVKLDPGSDEPGMVIQVSPGTPRFVGFR